MAKERINSSKADILMQSMRAMGYTFESAIADVIDNCISAEAKQVSILFPVEPSRCFVAICDDGEGMSSNELFEAMRYGSDVTKHVGHIKDLGRFGLGMKAASLSQCKKLTVISKKDKKLSAYCWDLDCVKKKCEWVVLELSQSEIKNLSQSEYLKDKESGTVVIWENFDVLEKSTGDVFSTLDEYKEKVERYLSLIFHRYLNDKLITIKINNSFVVGMDPFLEHHPKTNVRKNILLPLEDSDGNERYVSITPYILPFQKDMSKKDVAQLGGYEKLRTKQGFYIYRNKRLIIHGTWFGLAKNELTKHARIKVDIPSTLDDIWNIDIKKQNATIPKRIANQIKHAVEEAMGLAIKSQKYRGRIVNVDDDYNFVWNRIEERGKYLYKVNRSSAAFEFLQGDDITDSVRARIEMMIHQIEESVPYQQIYIDMSSNDIAAEDEKIRKTEILEDARYIIEINKKMGIDDIEIMIDKLFKSEPYCKYPDLADVLKEEFQ